MRLCYADLYVLYAGYLIRGIGAWERHGYPYPEAGPPPSGLSNIQFTAIALDDLLADGQAKTCSVLFPGIKWLKHLFQISVGNTRTIV
jgi:hypothetical protein